MSILSKKNTYSNDFWDKDVKYKPKNVPMNYDSDEDKADGYK